jgi:tRNA A-37 threonylcarbamoyl transferase component Bud32
VHESGHVYNDLKLENVMIEGDLVFLVDFGLATKYVDDDGIHLPPIEQTANF